MTEYYESGDWDKFWEDESGKSPVFQRIISRFRIHFDNQCIGLITSFGTPEHGKVLEVGCGTALGTHRLGEMGYDAYALDYSPKAAGLWNRNIANFAVADGFSLPFKSDSFDLVWNTGVMEHFSDPQPMLGEMIRVCRPGGIVCIIVPYIFDFTAHLKLYGEEQIFTRKRLRDELSELDDVKIKVLYKCGAILIAGWGRKKT